MVFAHTEKFNIADDNHIIGFSFKESAVDHSVQILGVTAGEELPAPLHPLGGLDQTFTLRVFAYLHKKITNQLLHSLELLIFR
jgi:hypothetical protein